MLLYPLLGVYVVSADMDHLAGGQSSFGGSVKLGEGRVLRREGRKERRVGKLEEAGRTTSRELT